MKETPSGRRLVDLYWQHTSEIVKIFVSHPEHWNTLETLLSSFQPGVHALLAGKGEGALISQSMIDQLNSVWASIVEEASSGLKSALVSERARYNGFQDFADKSFSSWAGTLEQTNT